MRGCREHFDAVAAAIHDREQSPGVGRGVLDVADPRMRGEPGYTIEREVRALELRIGVDLEGNINRIGKGAKIGFEPRVPKRKIGFPYRQDDLGPELSIRTALP